MCVSTVYAANYAALFIFDFILDLYSAKLQKAARRKERPK